MVSQNFTYNQFGEIAEVNSFFFKNDVEENRGNERKCLNSYTYGFNGMEKDDEITGQTDKGNHYTATFWEYDSRIGRRWNVDPVDKPNESSYLAFSGNPIIFVDPNGDNADGFTVDKKGNIKRVDNTGGDENDVIFSEESYSRLDKKDNHEEDLGSLVQGEDYQILNSGTFDKKSFMDVKMFGLDFKHTSFEIDDVQNADDLYKFVAGVSDVEWSYNWFKSDSKGNFALVQTSHESNFVRVRLLINVLREDDTAELLSSSHSHPGIFDPSTGWPAYPSGFDYKLNIKFDDEGKPYADRGHYIQLQNAFRGRVPSMFEIYVPNTKQYVLYDGNSVIR